jgi:hypothetical protein
VDGLYDGVEEHLQSAKVHRRLFRLKEKLSLVVPFNYSLAVSDNVISPVLPPFCSRTSHSISNNPFRHAASFSSFRPADERKAAEKVDKTYCGLISPAARGFFILLAKNGD